MYGVFQEQDVYLVDSVNPLNSFDQGGERRDVYVSGGDRNPRTHINLYQGSEDNQIFKVFV